MRKLLLLMIIVFSVTLFGCTDGGDQAQTTTQQRFVGGVDGVATTVTTDKATDAEAALVSLDESFSYVVTVENNGEYDLQPSDYIVKMIIPQDPGVFGGATYDNLALSNENAVAGTGLNPDGSAKPSGEDELATIPLQWTSSVTPTDYDLSYRYCYRYETKADTGLCKKSDLQGRISDEEAATGCNYPAFGSSVVQETLNSNAPVQFSDLTQTIENDQSVRFTFNLDIAGGGKVGLADQGREKLDRCEWKPNDRTADRVLVTITSELGKVECDNLKDKSSSTSGVLDITQGVAEFEAGSTTSKTITCTYTPENVGNAFDVLELSAAYDYAKTETLAQKITFIK